MNDGWKRALIGALMGGALGGLPGAAAGGLGGYLTRRKKPLMAGGDATGATGNIANGVLNDRLRQSPFYQPKADIAPLIGALAPEIGDAAPNAAYRRRPTGPANYGRQAMVGRLRGY